MPLRARTCGSSINKSFNGSGFLQRAGCTQCLRAVPSIGHLDWSQNFYYKLFPDVYDLPMWRIALYTSSTRWRWAKIMNYLRERKSHRQTLCLKYIQNPAETLSDLPQKSSHKLSLASLAAEAVLPYSFSFATFPNRSIPFFLTVLPPAVSVFFRVDWGWSNRVAPQRPGSGVSRSTCMCLSGVGMPTVSGLHPAPSHTLHSNHSSTSELSEWASA